MRTIRIKIYKYNELSELAKQKAISEMSDINVNYTWWDYIYADAGEIGLKITGFDLDRNDITGNLIEWASDVSKKIIENHGDQTDTYKLAAGYLAERIALIAKHSDGINTTVVTEENEETVEQLEEEQATAFEKALLRLYLKMLRIDYDYYTSNKAIEETIISNEYEFTADGRFWYDKR